MIMTDCGTTDGQIVDTTYKYLFDNSPNAVVFCDLAGVILFTNAAFERLFGFCETEIIGHHLKKVHLGHQAGDQLLIEVGKRLSFCVRTVARSRDWAAMSLPLFW